MSAVYYLFESQEEHPNAKLDEYAYRLDAIIYNHGRCVAGHDIALGETVLYKPEKR